MLDQVFIFSAEYPDFFEPKLAWSVTCLVDDLSGRWPVEIYNFAKTVNQGLKTCIKSLSGKNDPEALFGNKDLAM